MSLQNIFCVFSKKFQILIVLSQEPEITYLLSFVTTTLITTAVCPFITDSCLFSEILQILIVLSQDPEAIYSPLPLLLAMFK